MATRTVDNRRREGGGAPPAAQAQPQGEVSQYRWIILVGLILASMMEVLDTTIINVALPKMAGNLNATRDEIGWVATGYILSNVIVLPMTAWLSGRFGRRNYLSVSILIFIISSFFCGTSHGLVELVAWRILQGAGGAALLSTAQATLREIFPKDQQGIVQAIFLLGIVVAPTVGPALGGVITDNYTWPWVFFVNVPLGALALFLVYPFLQDSRFQKRQNGVDWLGIILLAVGLGSLQYVLEEGLRLDWFDSPLITALSVIAGVSLVSLITWELWPTNKQPIINLHILKNKELSASLVLFLVLGFGLFGGVFIFPIFVQNVLGFTPTATGLVLLPGGLATAVAVVFCGRLLNGAKQIVDVRVLILIGLVTFAFSMWQLSHLTTSSGEADTRNALIIRGFGLGFLFTPINFAAFNALKGTDIAQGSGLLNLFRQLGGSFGIAVLNTYITNQQVLHRYNIVSHLYPGDPQFAARQSALSHVIGTAMGGAGNGPSGSGQAALSAISRAVDAQAATQSFNDAFLLLMITFIFALPTVFLLRGQKKSGGGPEEMH